MYIYIYMCICIYIYIYIYMFMYIHMYVYPQGGSVNTKQYVHMLNSTLTATERTLCCLVENYQVYVCIYHFHVCIDIIYVADF